MSAAVHHTTAKVVVVGDSGVGKTGLGWRLAHGQFKEHASTHGQQFWVLDELRCRRTDGTECEAILWDLAGQPDYRLTHALFLDEADLALVVFDPTDIRDPLHGVEFWLKQLGACRAASPGSNNGCPIFLIGARADRGTSRLTQDELDEFCRTHGIAGGYLSTSAKAGDGVADLIERMRAAIPWDAKATTVTTATFKRIKDHVLKLKENRRRRKLIVSPAELRALLQKLDKAWRFTDEEMMAAVGNLQNYGYVKRLRTSEGAERVLLAPELLNNLAASFVLEARRSPKGLGSLDERKLLGGEYAFPELDKLPADQRAIMLDSAALLFLDHHVCFRETDPLGGQTYLVFPELINLKKPATGDEKPVEDGVAYTVGGAVENVMASLVVLMGYTDKFTRTNQWQNHARYEVGKGLVCGFRLEAERDGEMDLVLYFAAEVGPPIRQLFQGLFESFLARRNLTVARYEPVLCKNGHALDRSVLREHARTGSDVAYCSKCGDRLTLPKTAAPIQLTRVLEQQVVAQQTAADLRTRFEAAIFQVRTHVEAKGIHRPSCFISYAWGDPDQERWVERPLASDLRKAGIDVLLDQWHNAQIGKNVGRFVDRLEKVDRIIVVGTPRYREKYDNAHPDRGFVVAAEADIIMKRMQGSEAQKESVLPILREGTEATSFPPLIQGRVYADLRHERLYFFKAFDVILSLYEIAVDDPAVADLRTSLLFDRRLLGENVTFVR
jgi:small GTP-binding protein